MLTQEQANQLNLQQHALEAAQIGYNQVQAKIDEYDRLLNSIKDNYNSYSPEQKAKISSMMWQISAQYQDLKQQRQNYSLAQYEAQQQIWYYNNLAAQQPTGGQKRRVINPGPTPTPNGGPTPTPTPTPIPTPNSGPTPTPTPTPRGEIYDNTDIANKMFGTGNYQRISTYDWDYFRNWGTTIYPNGGISFEWVNTQLPESVNLYSKYYSYKADPNNGMHHLNYLHQNMPNYFNVDETGRQRLWMRMVRDGLNPGQADEFMNDWAESFTP